MLPADIDDTWVVVDADVDQPTVPLPRLADNVGNAIVSDPERAIITVAGSLLLPTYLAAVDGINWYL